MASLTAPAASLVALSTQRNCSASRGSSTSRAHSTSHARSTPCARSVSQATIATSAPVDQAHIPNVNNSHLPAGVDSKIWYCSFISTFFQWFAQQKNPWAMPSRQIVEVMQIMWDAFFEDIPQEITTTSVVYHLV